MNLFLIAKNAIWPWLFDHSDDIGVFLRIAGKDLIRWYAICILTGFFLCLVRCRQAFKKLGYDKNYFDDALLIIIPVAIVGARLWYVISEWKSFIVDGKFSFLNAINIMEGGLAVQGGVIFGVAVGIFYFTKIKNKYPISLCVDIAVPSIFLGQIVGRWGNFFNGEVYGKLVDRSSLSWWIPRFIIDYCTGTGSASQVAEEMVHIPLFYIEGLCNLVGFILIGVVAWKFWKKFRKPYQLGALYFIWYGLVRLILEPLRDDAFIMQNNFLGVKTSIMMSIIFIAVGVILFVFLEIYYWKVPFEEIYINKKRLLQEQEQEEKHQAELQAKIEAKKAEIRARKAKEKEDGNHE